MPEVVHRAVVPAPRAQIWAFVENIGNWAPMMTGYVGHQVIDARRSVWTLKGDTGVLARTVRLDIHVTEWTAPSRVTFTLKGINEAVEGGGSFDLEVLTSDLPPPPRAGLFRRLSEWFSVWVFRMQHGAAPAIAGGPVAESTVLLFTWRMDASGPTAPLVNALLEPALLPAAERLARSISARVTAPL